MAFLTTIKRLWYVPVIAIVLTTVLAIGASFAQPQRYQSEVAVLVIQQHQSRLDAYTAARSAQTVADTLVNVIYTSTFQEAVILNENYRVEDTFPKDPESRKNAWGDTVRARTEHGDGTIRITVLHEDRTQARAIAFSVAGTLIEKGREYHGGGQNIVVKMVDEPITSLDVAEPNIARNAGVGALIGALVGLGVILLLDGRESSFRDDDDEQGPTYGSSVSHYESDEEENDFSIMPTVDAYGTHEEDEDLEIEVEIDTPEAEKTQETIIEEISPVEAIDITKPEEDQSPIENPSDDSEDLFEIPAAVDETEEKEIVEDASNLQKEGEKLSRKEKRSLKKKKRKKEKKVKNAPKNVPPPSFEKTPGPAVVTSANGGKKDQIISFKGGLSELREQMKQRKTSREKQMKFTGNPIQRTLSEKSNVPAPSGSLSEQINAKLKERNEDKKDVKKEERKEEKKEKEEENPTSDPSSVVEWMRTGSFNKE